MARTLSRLSFLRKSRDLIAMQKPLVAILDCKNPPRDNQEKLHLQQQPRLRGPKFYLCCWHVRRNIWWSWERNLLLSLPWSDCSARIYPEWWLNWSFGIWRHLRRPLGTQMSWMSSVSWMCVALTSFVGWSICFLYTALSHRKASHTATIG